MAEKLPTYEEYMLMDQQELTEAYAVVAKLEVIGEIDFVDAGNRKAFIAAVAGQIMRQNDFDYAEQCLINAQGLVTKLLAEQMKREKNGGR